MARLVGAFDRRMEVLRRLEVTAYPRLDVTGGGGKSFLPVLALEFERIEPDLVFVFREVPDSVDLMVEGEAADPVAASILRLQLRAFEKCGPYFHWTVNESLRQFQPHCRQVPGVPAVPVEVVVGLPAALPASERVAAGLQITLAVSHAFREAREQGRLPGPITI